MKASPELRTCFSSSKSTVRISNPSLFQLDLVVHYLHKLSRGPAIVLTPHSRILIWYPARIHVVGLHVVLRCQHNTRKYQISVRVVSGTLLSLLTHLLAPSASSSIFDIPLESSWKANKQEARVITTSFPKT